MYKLKLDLAYLIFGFQQVSVSFRYLIQIRSALQIYKYSVMHFESESINFIDDSNLAQISCQVCQPQCSWQSVKIS